MNKASMTRGCAGDVKTTIIKLKEDMDFITGQLSSGDYITTDTFLNNWVHLVRIYQEVQSHLTNPDVVRTLAERDVMLAAELIAIDMSITMVSNFLRCLSAQNNCQAC